jgi:hypothetical protein
MELALHPPPHGALKFPDGSGVVFIAAALGWSILRNRRDARAGAWRD